MGMGSDQIDVARRCYPRICGYCGNIFTAARRHARWCSGRCRVAAWREQRSRDRGGADSHGQAFPARREEQVHAALAEARDAVCAWQGCQLTRHAAAGHAHRQDEHAAVVVPWRGVEWEHPTVCVLRARVSEQARELDRLREENGLLRRWVSRHVDVADTDSRGG
jgi:hypothetical protein